MRHQDTRTLYSVACGCGATATLDARDFGHPRVCPKCGNSFTVAWAKDPVTQRNAPIAVSLARKKPPTPLRLACTCGYTRAVTAVEAARHNRCPGCGKAMIVEKPASKSRDSNRIIKMTSAAVGPSKSPPPPPNKTEESSATRLKRIQALTPPPFTKPVIVCECGKEIEVLKVLGSGGTSCPACGREVRMETVRNPQSKHTLIRPRFGPKSEPPTAPKPPTVPDVKRQPEEAFGSPAAESVEEDAPIAIPAKGSYQELFCPCGEALMVGVEDAGRNIQCPTCSILISVEVIRDSKTNHTALRVKAIGKMDQDTWSLNDFS
jgi:hypothetical protein